MIRRRVLAAGLVFAGMLATELAAAGTASAHGGPGGQTSSTAGCNGGGSCWSGVSRQITISGGQPGQPADTGVSLNDIPPPACWLQYFTSGQGMEQWWKRYTRSGDPNVAAGLGNANIPQQVKAHQHDGSGAWYQAVENPSGPADGAGCVEQLGPFRWVPAGTQPPLPPIPARNLAMYAWANMHLPYPSFTLSPQRKSYVTLPVFVTGLTGTSQPYSITARINTIRGPESETVTATTSGVTFDTPTPDKFTNCGPDGTRESKAQMDKAGPGSKPDCGVVYTQPSTGFAQGYPFQVAATWTATATGTGPGGGLNNPIATVTMTGPNPPQYLPVAEIQSINKNG
jgi:hypothetical protein